jgi:AmmeMemoRadiSam system protein B
VSASAGRGKGERAAVFAGSWYPSDATDLRRFLEDATPPGDAAPAIALMAPHAGYRYSGAIAAETYARVAVPRSAIVLCPNHRVPPPVLAVWAAGSWRTPLGEAPIDEELAAALLAAARPLLRADRIPHEREHAAELQVPFLQFRRPDVKIVPIVVATDDPDELRALGDAIARTVRGRDVLLVASSDMNHFESAAVARGKDEKALARVLALDPEGLFGVVASERISMCGVRPMCVTLHAAKALGAARAELVRYGSSGDVSGDQESVVGYAGVVVS